MLARRNLPAQYGAWNKKHGAPFGFRRADLPIARRHRARVAFPRLSGPFGHQENSRTRIFEYPWAWHAVPVVAGTTAVDVGGSLAGFQFALAQAGVEVVNVDPGREATGRGWSVNAQSLGRLNRAFGTNVRLLNMTLAEAALPSNSVDTVYSISTIEHIPVDELPALMREIERILKPGGACVLTVDLFLNLRPFSNREARMTL